ETREGGVILGSCQEPRARQTEGYTALSLILHPSDLTSELFGGAASSRQTRCVFHAPATSLVGRWGWHGGGSCRVPGIRSVVVLGEGASEDLPTDRAATFVNGCPIDRKTIVDRGRDHVARRIPAHPSEPNRRRLGPIARTLNGSADFVIRLA